MQNKIIFQLGLMMEMMSKLVDPSDIKIVREVAENFGEIPWMRDEYFELQRDIQNKRMNQTILMK
jgi:hypothetical protein